MATYSIGDLSRKSGDIIADALRQPVTITQRNKPCLVLLSFEEFLSLIQNSDPRPAGMTANMPADLFEQAKKSLAEYEQADPN